MSAELLTEEFPISHHTQKDCYGKPCACLGCRNKDYSCPEDICTICTGKEFDRATELCSLDEL